MRWRMAKRVGLIELGGASLAYQLLQLRIVAFFQRRPVQSGHAFRIAGAAGFD